MRPDRVVALLLLAFCAGYVALALDYKLLPYERHLSFRPNTMPTGLGILGMILSLWVLAFPGGEKWSADAARRDEFKWRRGAAYVALMIAYALCLRPLGFLTATTVFLFIGGAILDRQKPLRLLIIAALAAVLIWLLVQKALGIYLSPLPTFIS